MRLSPILSLYIIRRFLLSMLMVMVLVMGVVVLFDVIELLRRASDRTSEGILVFIGLSLLKAPQLLHIILPFGVMIAAVSSFWSLTRSHELVVVRAAGVSAWQFLFPILGVVFIIGLIEVTLINPAATVMFQRYEVLEGKILSNRESVFDLSESGLWLREGTPEKQTVLYAKQVRQKGDVLQLSNLEIFIFGKKNDLLYSLIAKQGTFKNFAISLEDVLKLEVGKPRQNFDRMDIKSTLTLDLLEDNFSRPETVSFWELLSFIKFFDQAGFSTVRHWMYFQSLLAFPFLLCGMVLLAAPFSLRPNMRSGGVALRLGGVVAVGFGLYFFSRPVYALGQTATLPDILATWSPVVLALALGAVGVLHLEDG